MLFGNLKIYQNPKAFSRKLKVLKKSIYRRKENRGKITRMVHLHV